VFRFFELATMQKEYRLFSHGDLSLKEFWMLRVISNERSKWDNERYEDMRVFRESKLSGEFKDFERRKKGIREYL
jgi:hypothetical protein